MPRCGRPEVSGFGRTREGYPADFCSLHGHNIFQSVGAMHRTVEAAKWSNSVELVSWFLGYI